MEVYEAAPEGALARELRKVNLDLLPILHEILRTRSVSRAARALGVAQPSVSKALEQLRLVLGDELIVPAGRVGRLTERAQVLAGPVQQILNDVAALLQPDRPFDPAVERANLVIGAVDYVSALLAPALTQICAQEAPGVTFEFGEAAVRSVGDLVRLDFLIAPRGYGETLGKRLNRMPLWRDDYVCLAADDARPLPDRITPQAFQKARHVAYRMRPGAAPADVALALPTSAFEGGHVCAVPDFLVLGAIVEKTDCLALVPRKLARELVRQRAVRFIELAYARRHIDVDVWWSPAAQGRRGHAWARDLLTRAAAAFD